MLLILIIITSFIIARYYCEWCWKDVTNGRREYESISRVLLVMWCVNYGLAVGLSSPASLIFAITISLYQMVIFNYRLAKVNG